MELIAKHINHTKQLKITKRVIFTITEELPPPRNITCPQCAKPTQQIETTTSAGFIIIRNTACCDFNCDITIHIPGSFPSYESPWRSYRINSYHLIRKNSPTLYQLSAKTMINFLETQWFNIAWNNTSPGIWYLCDLSTRVTFVHDCIATSNFPEEIKKYY